MFMAARPAGADARAATDTGETLLHLASDPRLLPRLLRAGVPIEALNDSEHTVRRAQAGAARSGGARL